MCALALQPFPLSLGKKVGLIWPNPSRAAVYDQVLFKVWRRVFSFVGNIT